MLPEVDKSKIERLTDSPFQFLKRYKARRAIKKAIAMEWSRLTSVRITLATCNDGARIYLINWADDIREKITVLEKQKDALCKL